MNHVLQNIVSLGAIVAALGAVVFQVIHLCRRSRRP